MNEEVVVEIPELSQDYSVYEDMDHLIQSVISEYELNPAAVSVAFYNYQTGEEYLLNERETIQAGSTIKVGLARLYMDLISDGQLTLQSELPYSEFLYEDGAGPVTNGEKKAAYPIYELFYHSLSKSDNTAFNILFYYYQQNYGNVYQALRDMSGLEFDTADDSLVGTADAHMLLNILKPIGSESKYSYILTALSGNENAEYFKKYVQDGMYTKYGSINGSMHDTGIYIEGDEPVYALVVMTNGQGTVEDFLGMMNYRIYEWTQYQNYLAVTNG
ncbi:serine hydrolase [Aerococcaceae bacterium WGS1372]